MTTRPSQITKRPVDHLDFCTVYPWSCFKAYQPVHWTVSSVHFIPRTFLGQFGLVGIVKKLLHIPLHAILATFSNFSWQRRPKVGRFDRQQIFVGHGRWKRFKKELNWDLRDEECLKNIIIIIIIKQSNFHSTHTYPLLPLLEMSMTTSAPECSGKNPTNVAQYWKILGWYCHEPNYCYKRLLCPSLLKVDTFRAIFYFKNIAKGTTDPRVKFCLPK